MGSVIGFGKRARKFHVVSCRFGKKRERLLGVSCRFRKRTKKSLGINCCEGKGRIIFLHMENKYSTGNYGGYFMVSCIKVCFSCV